MRFLRLFAMLILVLGCGPKQSDTVDTAQDPDKTPETPAMELADSSTIQCPFCGFEKREELPTEVCLISYDCDSCKKTIHPEDGDCCVFCSHGDHECPSMAE